MQTRSAGLIVRIASCACLVFAAYRCLLFARAQFLYQLDTATSIPAAVALVPYNSSYVSRLASWQPDRKEDLLNRAVALNPFDVESLTQLGLTAELQDGDSRAAERYCLRAAEVDKMFRPRWTLTNFYFRQHKPAEFFQWARSTLDITPYPAEPVFAQMWLMSQDTAKLSAVVPDRPSILIQYAMYLAKEKQFDSVPSIIQRLTARVNAQNAHAYGRDDMIGPMEDQLLLQAHIDSAFEIWRSLAKARWLPYAAPTSDHPLTNEDFGQAFFGHGFDWAVATNINGVSVAQDQEQRVVRISFNGDEPERVPLLRQFIPLQPDRMYRLAWRAEGDNASSQAGLRWYIHPLGKNGLQDLESGDLLLSGSPHWDFKADTNVGLLTLEYARPLGNTRATGNVTLRSVSLKETGNPNEKI